MKKFGALLLAIVMVLSLMGVAMASSTPSTINDGNTSDAPDLGTGTIVGESGTWKLQDTAIVQKEKSINIIKELKAYNPNGTTVNAPAFSYVYTVTAADVGGYTVTDDKTDHVIGASVTAPVQKGLMTGISVSVIKPDESTVTGQTSGDNATVELAFTNNDTLTTTSTGYTHTYKVNLDFDGVTFSEPGVYRYKIDETIKESLSYEKIAIKDGGTNTLYLDVYVDGNGQIYGFVCMPTNDNVTTSTPKTDRFGPDEYFTYDLKLSKTVENDGFGESHEFPFSVIFSNVENQATTSFVIKEHKGSTDTTGTEITKDINAQWGSINRVAKVREGTDIIYKGIPAGISFEVYETNDVNGVTYTVETSLNGGNPKKDDSVTSTTEQPSTSAQAATKKAYESTKVNAATTLHEKVDNEQTVAITNTLLLISPTGVVLRIAPYAMILAAGIALLLISRRRTATVDED